MAKCKECKTELTAGENWYVSYATHHDFRCIECAKAYSRQYCAKHREGKRAYNRQWYEEHQEERAEYRRQQYIEHREERLAYTRQWLEEHPDYERQWCRENPGKARERSRRYHARKANATINDVDEMTVYELYNQTCIYCGCTENLTLDHIVPLNNGGAHTEDNLTIACRSCNSSKCDTPLIMWLQTQPYSRMWVL